jgi:KipI family sensor histidine kinase inhibitor
MSVDQLAGLVARPVGAHAVMLDLPDQQAVHRLANWLLRGPFDDVIEDVVPGARTVLVIARGEPRSIAGLLQSYSESDGDDSSPTRTVSIPVTYDGPDVDEVCSVLGIGREDLAAAHTGSEHVVAFFGFTPGFAYFDGTPSCLNVPRRPSPRVNIPAGSVAIANGYTVIYPGRTPGGWNVIGHTTYPPLWDSTVDPPNLLSVGDRIRFQAIR